MNSVITNDIVNLFRDPRLVQVDPYDLSEYHTYPTSYSNYISEDLIPGRLPLQASIPAEH